MDCNWNYLWAKLLLTLSVILLLVNIVCFIVDGNKIQIVLLLGLISKLPCLLILIWMLSLEINRFKNGIAEERLSKYISQQKFRGLISIIFFTLAATFTFCNIAINNGNIKSHLTFSDIFMYIDLALMVLFFTICILGLIWMTCECICCLCIPDCFHTCKEYNCVKETKNCFNDTFNNIKDFCCGDCKRVQVDSENDVILGSDSSQV